MRRQYFTWYFLLAAAWASSSVGIGAALSQPPSVSGAWSSKFPPAPGANSQVNAMATYQGQLLVGGDFTEIAGVSARGLARWNGTNWSEFHGGVSGTNQPCVNALLVEGTNLYVGGRFNLAGQTGAENVARWAGDRWEPLGEGVSSRGLFNYPATVTSFHRQGADLFVGGMFQYAGAAQSTSIARWDGAAWHSVGGGVYIPWDFGEEEISRDGRVYSVTGDGTNIYVGGVFLRAGDGLNITNLACWNGASWRAIGNTTQGGNAFTFEGERLDGWVYSLVWRENSLWVGGDFKRVNDLAITNLARWNGAEWEAPATVEGSISTLKEIGARLYVLGDFDRAGSIAATNIAFFETGGITALHTKLNQYEAVATVHNFDGQLFAGGYFGVIEGVSAGSIAKRVGDRWEAVAPGRGNGFLNYTYGVVVEGQNIYVPCYNTSVGTNETTTLAKWDGTSWSNVPRPDWVAPSWATILGKDLVVASGGWGYPIFARNIGRWDGRGWNPLGDVPIAVDHPMVVIGTNLFVSGRQHTNSTGVYQLRDEKWQLIRETIWAPNLATDGTNLYTALPSGWGFQSPTHISRWDGQTWVEYPASIPIETVAAMGASSATNIWVSGYKTNGAPSSIFRWNGAAWIEWTGLLNNGGSIDELRVFADKTIAAGSFEFIDGVKANSLALWDGERWRPFDGGLRSLGGRGWSQGLALAGKQMVVAGLFDHAGSTPSGSIAIWNFASDIHLRQATPTRLEISGGVGDRLGVETTVDFLNWNSVGEVTLTAPTQTLNLRGAAKPAQVFRARILEP